MLGFLFEEGQVQVFKDQGGEIAYIDFRFVSLAARFVAGLPHGAYFGVASLVAASLVAPHLRGRAVSSVMLGLAVANVAGVPAATWLGQQLGWRSAYWAVVVIGALTIAAVATVVPASPRNRAATVRTELTALRRPQVLLTLLVGVVGFGGMFEEGVSRAGVLRQLRACRTRSEGVDPCSARGLKR